MVSVASPIWHFGTSAVFSRPSPRPSQYLMTLPGTEVKVVEHFNPFNRDHEDTNDLLFAIPLHYTAASAGSQEPQIA